MPTIYREGKLAGLNKAIGQVGQVSMQKQLQDTQRRQELQDAIRKSLITAKLEGKIGDNLDIGSLASGGELPDLSNLQITPDIDMAYKKARLGELAQKMEKTRQLNVLGGLEAPSEEDVATVPKRLGFGKIVEGGEVMSSPGATFKDGQIISPTGEMAGEYLEGYEPKQITPTSQEIIGTMRSRIAPGIPQEELAREALGLPKAPKTVTRMQSMTNTNKVMNNIVTKEDLQELIDNRSDYEAEGVDVDKVIETLSYLIK